MASTNAAFTHSSHGPSDVAIVACPTLIPNRLLHLSVKGEFSWALRDYIGGMMLRSGDSELTFTNLESLITYSEKPPYRSVNRTNEWREELIGSSRREFGARYDATTPPSRTAGTWKRIS